MFDAYVFEESGAVNCTSILLVDYGVEERIPYGGAFEQSGFSVVRWVNDLAFRVEWEASLKRGEKIAVIAKPDDYIPYDLMQRMDRFDVSLQALFPRLDATTLAQDPSIDFDLLSTAYARDFVRQSDADATRIYLDNQVNSCETAKVVFSEIENELLRLAVASHTYRDWFKIAWLKARGDILAARYDIEEIADPLINEQFARFLMARYGQLTMALDDETPVLVKFAMEYMHRNSGRFALVIMDGMSLFDWCSMRDSLSDIEYRESAAFAIVPTITSLSRQSLVSGKFPKELSNPWSTSRERSEFLGCMNSLGYDEGRVVYLRDYNSEVPPTCDCAVFIILDVDKRVHGQHDGRAGMLADDELLASEGNLAKLIKRLSRAGLDVYVTSDHGNTPCVGQGRMTGTGVETETKSRRMYVANSLAEHIPKCGEYELIQCPGGFLPDRLTYYVCPFGVSFDNPGEKVMGHGGMSIDEVIVPFVFVKAENA